MHLVIRWELDFTRWITINTKKGNLIQYGYYQIIGLYVANMNDFDEIYNFRLAYLNDVDSIMSFVANEWKSDHILAKNKKFFLYEFGDGERINFIIAQNKETKSIDGILGYLKASKGKECLDIWGVMWKVTNKRPVAPFLGIELMKRLMSMTGCRTEIGVGANPKTSIPLLKLMLKFWVGKMKHYYRLSNRIEYKIANIKEVKMLFKTTSNKYKLKRYDNIDNLILDFNFEERREVRPYKDSWYVNRRFFKHPIYKYNIYGTYNCEEKVDAIIVTREITCNNSKILRIVDFIGDGKSFSGLYDEFSELLNKYEYIDFYCYGLEDEYVKQAGFIEILEDDENIIPNYFEPFVQSNVDIWINSTKDGCMFFKADGDQDRPNII